MTSKPTTCALCTAFELAFAALDRDRDSRGPQIHRARLRRVLEDARKDHRPEHHARFLSPALEAHNRQFADYLSGLAAEINTEHAIAAEGTKTA